MVLEICSPAIEVPGCQLAPSLMQRATLSHVHSIEDRCDNHPPTEQLEGIINYNAAHRRLASEWGFAWA